MLRKPPAKGLGWHSALSFALQYDWAPAGAIDTLRIRSPTMANPSHITQAQLAARWHISERTLEAWRWQGLGPRFLKIGGRVRYRLLDVEAFEDSGLRPAPSSAGDHIA